VLSWTEPSWAGSSPVSHYEIGSGNGTVATWTDAGYVFDGTVSLPVAKTGMYSVRAVNNAGQSVGADLEFVDVANRTQLVSPAYPVSVSSSGRDVTVNFFSKLAVSKDLLDISLLPGEGWSYRDQRTVTNGEQLAVSFDDVPSGRYRLLVLGRDSKNPKDSGTDLFNQEVFVNDSAVSMNSVDVSFTEGTDGWHGVYPTASLPIVSVTKKLAYDGATSMAITATKDSIGKNNSASAGLARAVPTAAGQQLVVGAQGFATSQATQWNLGIAWWNAKGEKIAVTRTKRLRKTVGDWKGAGGTFTAPAGAVSAGAFVEIGELLRGQNFYVDDIALRSFTPTPRVQSSADWTTLQGQAQVSDGSVVMPSTGDTEVLDSKTPGADMTINLVAKLRGGTGYGVQLRASQSAGKTSGYVVQLEQTANGWVYTLRQRKGGTYCAKALATSDVVTWLVPTTAHNLIAKITGDTLTVTVGGKQVLKINSLSGAGLLAGCGAAPTGTAVGLLKQGGAVVEFTGTVLVKN
jgi:hypothetical protein